MKLYIKQNPNLLTKDYYNMKCIGDQNNINYTICLRNKTLNEMEKKGC